VDGPTSLDEAKRQLYEYTYLRKLSTAFPYDFAQYLKKIGKDAQIYPQRNEADLLKAAMEKLGELDPDIIVGHSFSRIDIDVLLHRMQKFDTTTWSKLGRLHNTKYFSLSLSLSLSPFPFSSSSLLSFVLSLYLFMLK
jgi:DNA polymerase alpha subunit A